MADTLSDEELLKKALLSYFHGDWRARAAIEAYILKHGLATFRRVGGPILLGYIEATNREYLERKKSNVVSLYPAH